MTYKANLWTELGFTLDAKGGCQNHFFHLIMVMVAAQAWVQQLGNIPAIYNLLCLEGMISDS